jgi:hypothetical protein
LVQAGLCQPNAFMIKHSCSPIYGNASCSFEISVVSSVNLLFDKDKCAR